MQVHMQVRRGALAAAGLIAVKFQMRPDPLAK